MKTPKQVQAAKREAKAVEHEKLLKEKEAEWDPQALGEHATTDPFKTLFVARISLDVTERKLVKEYSRFGTITKCVMIMDKEGEPRGYAFLEFEKEADMREAYKKGDGLKIHGRRVLVDVERGRTVRGWKPRRLGGGLGGTRKGGKTENVTHSGRMDAYRGGGSRSYSDRGRRDYDRSRRSDRDRGRGRERRDDRGRERRDRDRSDRKRDRDRGERGDDRKRARD